MSQPMNLSADIVKGLYLNKGNQYIQYPNMKAAINKAMKGGDVSEDIKKSDFFDKREVKAGFMGAMSEFFKKIGDWFASIGHSISMLNKGYAKKFSEEARKIAIMSTAFAQKTPDTTPPPIAERKHIAAQIAEEAAQKVAERPKKPEPTPEPAPAPAPAPQPVMGRPVPPNNNRIESVKETVEAVVARPDENAAKITELQRSVKKLEELKSQIDAKKADVIVTLAQIATEKEKLNKEKTEIQETFNKKLTEKKEYLTKLSEYDETSELEELKKVAEEHGKLVKEYELAKNTADKANEEYEKLIEKQTAPKFADKFMGLLGQNLDQQIQKKSQELSEVSKKLPNLEQSIKEKAQAMLDAQSKLEAKQAEKARWAKIKDSLEEEAHVCLDDEQALAEKEKKAIEKEQAANTFMQRLNQKTVDLDQTMAKHKEEIDQLGAKPSEAPLAKRPPKLIPVPKPIPSEPEIPTPPAPPAPLPPVVPVEPPKPVAPVQPQPPAPKVGSIKAPAPVQPPKKTAYEMMQADIKASTDPEIAKLLMNAFNKFSGKIVGWKKVSPGQYKLEMKENVYMRTLKPEALMTFNKEMNLQFTSNSVAFAGVTGCKKVGMLGWIEAALTTFEMQKGNKEIKMSGKATVWGVTKEDGEKVNIGEAQDNWSNGIILSQSELAAYKKKNKIK